MPRVTGSIPVSPTTQIQAKSSLYKTTGRKRRKPKTSFSARFWCKVGTFWSHAANHSVFLSKAVRSFPQTCGPNTPRMQDPTAARAEVSWLPFRSVCWLCSLRMPNPRTAPVQWQKWVGPGWYVGSARIDRQSGRHTVHLPPSCLAPHRPSVQNPSAADFGRWERIQNRERV
jgi:hypothetical protein